MEYLIIPYDKSFASHEKSVYWSNNNVDKDGNLIQPHQVFKSTKDKYLFNCNLCGHVFDIQLCNITNGNNWCSYCSKPPKKICFDDNCILCYNKSFASHEMSKYWSNSNIDKNGIFIKPRQVFKKSGKQFIFECDVCNHSFPKSLDNITIGNTWCPYCCNPTKLVCGNKSCIPCFNKSFASHEMSKYWSNNNKLDPINVTLKSNNIYLFNCNLCGHEIEKALNNICAGSWCAYCCDPPQKLCSDNNCNACFNKSFASHSKCNYWSKNNIDNKGIFISPRQVFKYSDTIKYKLFCDVCNHEFERALYNINDDSDNTHCIYCVVPTKIICNNLDCAFCYERSFASHSRSIYWSNTNEINPRDVIKWSNKKYNFICERHGEFPVSPSHICSGTWCPHCHNKTEGIFYDKIKTLYPNLESQFKTMWCKNSDTNRYLPFDFVLHEYKIIIELDGEQHFSQVSNWTSPEYNFAMDKYKQDCANKNGYSVIRLLQNDVFNNNYDWVTEIINNINAIIEDKVVQNIYMFMNDEYNKHIL